MAGKALPEAPASPHQVLGWFNRMLPKSFFESLKQDLEIVENSCVYTLTVTTWLMILQRLSSEGTLASAVSQLSAGCGRELLEPCKQVREGRISINTGAYSHARERIPVEAAWRITQRTFNGLVELAPAAGIRNQLYVLDGSSIRLAHTPGLLKLYPAASNQHGESHWPVLKLAVLHHVATGLAMAPAWGPMYGCSAVSEQALAGPLIDRLPPSSILIADRNFGVFSIVWRAHRAGHRVLVRLTKARAGSIGGAGMIARGGGGVKWQPSPYEIRAHPELAGCSGVEGRLIVCRLPHMQEPLYLFTTLEQAVGDEQVVALYAERWNIETDLRSLKTHVRLEAVSARSPDLVACELLLAIASYNFIRAVMSELATQTSMDPRRLSFSRCRTLILAFTQAAALRTDANSLQQHWSALLRALAQCKLPRRSRPTAPRQLWPKPRTFPARKPGPAKV